jgi:two-component system, LytTR family, sensor histidine kinase AlgZ
MLRVLLLVNAMLAGFSLTQTRPLGAIAWVPNFLAAAAAVEPVLIASLAALCPVRGLLRRLGYGAGVAAIIVLELLLAAAMRWVAPNFVSGWDGLLHDWLVTLMVSATVLYYFNLRERAFSPALVQARLQALQARIRPHFLFNSLTAVLSLIRSEPKRAETALEDLADLFRVLLREQRKLVPLSDEIDLCKRYLAIESLRLGDRLGIDWRIDDQAVETAMPPLILQPLVENAVHHGIEPAVEAGMVSITIARRGAEVEIVIVNPLVEGGVATRTGNHMALDNVRERLALHFDVEARLEATAGQGEYRLRIVLPFRRYVERDERGES